MLQRLAHPYLLLTLAVLFWAGNSIVGRAYASDVPPVALVFWRWVIAACILSLVCLKHFLRDLPIIRKNLPFIIVQGGLSIAAFNTLLYWGLHYTTVVNTALIQAGIPVIVLFFSILILRKGVTKLGALGIMLSLLGVAWVIARGEPGSLAQFTLNPGDLLIVASVIAWGMYSVLLAKTPTGLSRLAFTLAMVLCGLVLLLPLYAWELSTGAGFTLDADTLPAFAYIGIFPSVLSLLCWNRGVELIGANRAGVFLYLMPIFGATLGMLLLGEVLEVFHFVGIALVIAGIWLATTYK